MFSTLKFIFIVDVIIVWLQWEQKEWLPQPATQRGNVEMKERWLQLSEPVGGGLYWAGKGGGTFQAKEEQGQKPTRQEGGPCRRQEASWVLLKCRVLAEKWKVIKLV